MGEGLPCGSGRLGWAEVLQMTTEHWKPIPGYESRYEVSSRGRVRSNDMVVPARNGKTALRRGRLLKLKRGGGGYLAVNLCDGENPPRTVAVHILVAAAFLGPRPEGMYVCHGDGDKRNNALCNLRYGTPKDNNEDAFRHGTHYTQKLTEQDARDIRHCAGLIARGTLAEVFGVSRAQVNRILSGRSWTCLQ